MYDLKQTADEVLADMVEAGQEYIAEIEELVQIAKNPEKLVGKKYDEMTPADFQLIHTVKGQEFFNDWFVDKEYKKVRELEAS